MFGTLTKLILKPLNKLLLIISIFLCNSLAFCQISVNNSAPYDDVIFLVNDVLLSANLQTSNHDYSGHPLQIAYFNGELSNIGFNSGIVMSTNDVSFIAPGFVGPSDFVNQDPSVTDADLLTIANSVPDLIGQNFQVSSVNNIAILEFDFIPSSDSISFRYVFGSEEYNTYENSMYNDVFGFFLSGPGISGSFSSPANFPDGSINIATFSSQEPNSLNVILPITISSINNAYNSQFYIDNQSLQSVNTADGFTTVMTASAVVQCGETYHIRLAIAHGSDSGLASYVFLEENSFSSAGLNVSNSITSDTNYLQIPCGDKVNLTANIESGVDYNFLWSNGDTTQSIYVGAGSYAVKVIIDGCGIVSDTIKIEEIPISIDLGQDLSVCKFDYIDLDIKHIQSDNSPFAYLWSNGSTNETTNVTVGAHSIKVTDSKGCIATDTIIVRELDRPTAYLTGEGNICEGQTENLPEINVQFTGEAPFHFLYSNGINNYLDSSQIMNYSFTAHSMGDYSIKTLEDANCIGSPSNIINITSTSSSSLIESSQQLCEGDSALLTVHTEVDAPPYSLHLFNGSFNQVFDGLTTSKFQVYVTDTALYSVKLFDKFNCESQINNGTAYIRYKDPIFPQFITSFDSVLCPVDPPVLLEAMPDGGVFSGKGVGFNGYFHPVNAFEGESYLYYSFPLNCNETDSILIDVSCDVKIYVPNSFTPNNDFINDFLEVRGVNIIDFEFSIYSRWSEQIFYTKDINHYWDGTFKGRLVPTGTYTYTISAYGKDAKMLRLNGHVNVIH